MACRFNRAATVDEFWEHVAGGHELIDRLSDEDLRSAGEPEAWFTSPDYVKACGFIDRIDEFDAAFFGLNPKEAEILDPQSRVFLECCWEALEDACCVPSGFPGRIGVFGGKGMNEYYLSHLRNNGSVLRSVGPLALHVSNDGDYLATRVSYTLNLNGPSLCIQTASSTSLVAVCLGSQSLLTFESDVVLAGGVYLRLRKTGYRYQEGALVSPDGHCRTFDAKARGTIFNSGAGVVVLKRLSDAVADGDNIRAVIRGFALNNDGSAKVGFTAPSVKGQAEVIQDALAMANVNPERIGFVEAHGTATELGDPIEIAALTKAYRGHTQKRGFCAVGSVKTNLGHTHSAAGAAGLIKAVLTLQHGLIPPNVHFENPNPAIDFSSSPFFVNSLPLEWPSDVEPRMAAVSAFGVGGTNAHVILEEAARRQPVVRVPRSQLLVLSAMDDAALDAATDRLSAFLEHRTDVDLADVAYSLQVGRKRFGRRRVLVCRDRAAAAAALAVRDPVRVLTTTGRATPRIVFLFPGRESEHSSLGVQLYRDEPIFRDEVDRCLSALKNKDDAEYRLDGPHVTEPMLFILEYALAKLWMAWGIHPETMVGEGVGERVAACLAGAVSLDDALALVCERWRLLQQVPAGAAVPLPNPEIASGRFADQVGELLKEPDRVFLEVGLGQAMTAALTRLPASFGRTAIASLPELAAGGSDRERLLHALGELWMNGAIVDWDRVHATDAPRRVPLPTYPFQRQRYWIDPPMAPNGRHPFGLGAGRSKNPADWFYVPSWRRLPPAATTRQSDADPTWLVFHDMSALCEQLCVQLEATGHVVRTVAPGPGFAQRGPTQFAINPSEPADYRAVIEAVDTGSAALHIVYAWSLAAALGEPHASETCFHRLLHLAQALGRRRDGLDVEIEIIGTGTHEVTGAESIVPESALALGPCRTIPHDLAGIKCRHIDVDLPESSRLRSSLVDQLIAEFHAAPAESVVAYRGGYRWAQTFEKIRLDAPADESALRPRGVYLVTGGSGGIGLMLAEYLAGAVQARLALVSRSPFPARSHWEEWLASHDDGDRVSVGIRKLLECERRGGEVLTFSADVTSEPQMRAVIESVTDRWGAIHGVFHGAGVAGGGLIQLKTRQAAEAVLAPKVAGTRVLAEIFADRPLDLFVMFSSMIAIVPVVGQVDYAAANAFMDAFAHAMRRKTAARVVSVDWDAWQDVGMYAATQQQRRFLQGPSARPHELPAAGENLAQRRVVGLRPHEALDALRWILATTLDTPQMVVSIADFAGQLARAKASAQTPLLKRLEQRPAEPKATHQRPPLPVTYVAPRDQLERSIAEAWQSVLGISGIGVHDGFAELGGNSLLSVQVAAQIRNSLRLTLSLEDFFKAPTVAELAQILAPRLSVESSSR
jgi:acyl transferase domain-containing protein